MKNGDGKGVYWVSLSVQVHQHFMVKQQEKQLENEQPHTGKVEQPHSLGAHGRAWLGHDRASPPPATVCGVLHG